MFIAGLAASTGSSADDSLRDDRREDSAEASKVGIGYAISPVQLNTRGKDRAGWIGQLHHQCAIGL
jgi:hypothetical protein